MSGQDTGGRLSRPGAARALRVAGLVAVLAFLAFGQSPDRTRFWTALFEFGHAPLFGVVALLVRGLIPPGEGGPWRSRSLGALILTLGIGAATEVVQIFQSNHDASLVDLARDGAGAAAFLLLKGAPGLRRRLRAAGRPAAGAGIAVAAAVALLVLAGAELLSTVAVYAGRERAFPTLYALDGSRWERALIRTGRNRLTPNAAHPRPDPAPGVPLARLDLRPGRYSGLTFDEPHPDWRGHRRLTFTVVSDLDAPLRLSIRVHDAAHNQKYGDRFNRVLVVRPGVNRVSIPLDDIRTAPAGRPMDVRRIRGIVIFTRVERETHLYLGAFRLE